MGCLSVHAEVKNSIVSVAIATGFSLCAAANPIAPSISASSQIKNDLTVITEINNTISARANVITLGLTCSASIVCTASTGDLFLNVFEGHLVVQDGFLMVVAESS